MSRHAMNPVDAAWYHMDSAANPAVVTSLITTRRPLRFDCVQAVLQERLLRFDRFRQRVVERGLAWGSPQWEDVPDFQMQRHLHHLALPAPHDAHALRALVGDLASTPLPDDVPLWQAYVIDDVGHGSALVLRYHHCIGDGAAMMTVAESLFDSAGAAAVDAGFGDPLPAPPEGSLLQTALAVAAHPSRVIDAAVLAAGAAQALVGELVKPADPPSPFKGRFRPQQKVAWSAPIPLDALKTIAEPFNAKINDVLVALLAGALRAYLAERGVAVDATTLRAMVPVNLRPPERARALGNEFGLVILDLPVSARDAVKRVSMSKARMDALKHSAEPVAMEWLFDLFGRGPKAVQGVAQWVFGSKTSVVLTNVPGPRERLMLTGVPVDELMFWVPHPGDELGMGLSLISYCGHATLGVIADAHRVPDPERIAQGFDAEFARLAERLRRAQRRRQQMATASHGGR
jgi:WS/DGAT/MGAT family acyltransferase